MPLGVPSACFASLSISLCLSRPLLGRRYGTPVAVKVIDEDVRPSAKQQVPGSRRSGDSASVYSSAAGGGGGLVPHLEALMAHELRHPNIVATLKYGTTMVSASSKERLGRLF